MGSNKLTYFEALTLYSMNAIISILLSIIANAFFLAHYSTQYLPYFYLGQAVVTALITSFTQFVSSKGKRNHLVFIQIAFILLTVVFSPLTDLKTTNFETLFFPFFLFTVSTYVGIVTSNCVSQAFDFRTYKKASNSILIMSTGIVSVVTFCLASFKSTVKISNLTYYAIGLMILATVFCFIIPQSQRFKQKQTSSKAAINYPLYRILFVFTFGIYAASILSDYSLKYQLAVDLSQSQIARFLLYYTPITSLLCLGVLGICQKFIQSLTVAILLTALPVFYIIASLLLFAPVNIWTVAILAAGNPIFSNSTYLMGREFSILAFPGSISSKIRSYLKSLAQVGGVVTGVLITWMFKKQPNFIFIGVFIMTMMGILVRLSFNLQRVYLETLKSAISLKRFDVSRTGSEEEALLASKFYYRSILKGFNSADPHEISFCFFLLRNLNIKKLSKEILRQKDSSHSLVRAEFVRHLIWLDDKSNLGLLYDLIDKEEDRTVIKTLLHALSNFKGREKRYLIKKFIQSNYPDLRAGAIHLALSCGDLEEVEEAIDELRRMISADNIIDREEAARLLGYLPVGMPIEEIAKLIQDKNPVVSIAAIKSIYHQENSAFIPLLVKSLATAKVSYYCIRDLVAHGKDALVFLEEALETISHPVDNNIIITIARIEDPEAEKTLIKIANRKNVFLLNAVAKESAKLACRKIISKEYKVFILSQIARECQWIRKISALILENFPDPLKKELGSRKLLAIERLVNWIAAISHNPTSVLELMPVISHAESMSLSEEQTAYAEEALIGYVPRPSLKKAISDCLSALNPKKALKERDLSIFEQDAWLSRIYQYYQRLEPA